MGGCCVSEAPGTQNERLGDQLKSNDKDAANMGNKGHIRKKMYAKNIPLKLGYWNMRGLAQPILYLLEYIQHPYEEDIYEQGPAPEYKISQWTNKKHELGLDFPALPYLIDNNDGIELKLTDTYTIMRYIA